MVNSILPVRPGLPVVTDRKLALRKSVASCASLDARSRLYLPPKIGVVWPCLAFPPGRHIGRGGSLGLVFGLEINQLRLLVP